SHPGPPACCGLSAGPPLAQPHTTRETTRKYSLAETHFRPPVGVLRWIGGVTGRHRPVWIARVQGRAADIRDWNPHGSRRAASSGVLDGITGKPGGLSVWRPRWPAGGSCCRPAAAFHVSLSPSLRAP